MVKKILTLIFVLTLFCVVLKLTVPTLLNDITTKTTKNYTITECTDNDDTYLVTMRGENKTQNIVFEIKNDEFDKFNFSENKVITLNIETTGKIEKYSFNGKHLMTKTEIDNIRRIIAATLIITAIIILIIMFLICPEGTLTGIFIGFLDD